MFSINKVRF